MELQVFTRGKWHTFAQPRASGANGRVTVANDPDPRAVLVKTYDKDGNAVEAPFHPIVAC